MLPNPPKSSINILQEIAITKFGQNPNYSIKDVSPSVHSPRFLVTVNLGKISCSAEANNKKVAKDTCARLALNELRLVQKTEEISAKSVDIDETDHSPEDLVNYNVIGSLNEYTAKNNIPYAQYTETGTNETGHFIIECKLGELIAHGLGANKKIAKKNSAAALLKKLKPRTPPKLHFPTPEKIPRLIKEEVNCTSTSATATIIAVKTEETVEEKSMKEENVEENEDVTATAKEFVAKLEKCEELTVIEKAEEISEEAILEDFRLKLSKLGLKDDNNLIIHYQSKSRILSYKNDDYNLNIVKISYNVKRSLNELYNDIKERLKS